MTDEYDPEMGYPIAVGRNVVKFVVKTANRIDKTPHFRIPVNLVRYF